MGAGASSRAAAGAPAAAAKYGKESDAYRKLQSEYDKLQVAHKELLDKLAGLDGFDAPSASSDVPTGAKTGPTAPAAAVPSRTASKGHVISRPKFVSASERSLEPTVRQESRIKAAIAKHSPALRGRIVAIQGDMQTVRKAFDELAKIEPPTDQIKFKEFATVLIDRLGIGLSEVELGRVWDGLTPEQVGVPREARTLNFDGFSAGLGQITFLRDVMTEWVLQSEPWKIPDEYDYEKSSNDNYGAPPASWWKVPAERNSTPLLRTPERHLSSLEARRGRRVRLRPPRR